VLKNRGKAIGRLDGAMQSHLSGRVNPVLSFIKLGPDKLRFAHLQKVQSLLHFLSILGLKAGIHGLLIDTKTNGIISSLKVVMEELRLGHLIKMAKNLKLLKKKNGVQVGHILFTLSINLNPTSFITKMVQDNLVLEELRTTTRLKRLFQANGQQDGQLGCHLNLLMETAAL